MASKHVNLAAERFRYMASNRALFPGGKLLTGVAGTGKSTLIREFLADRYALFQRTIANPDERKNALVVSAYTASAALLLTDMEGGRWSGRTFCSAMEWKPAADDSFKSLTRMLRDLDGFATQRIKQMRCLVVDEASMVQPTEFAMMNPFLQAVRGSTEDWGGVEVVFVGDFHQLGPVLKTNAARRVAYTSEEALFLKMLGDLETPPEDCAYAFQLPAFDRLVPHRVLLTHVYRQEDRAFVDLLNRVSMGRMTEEDEEVLEACEDTVFPAGVEPMQLVPKKDQAEVINQRYFDALPRQWPKVEYKTSSSRRANGANGSAQALANDRFLAGREEAIVKESRFASITLLKGTAVIVTVNTEDKQVCNGRQGKVVDFVRCGPGREEDPWGDWDMDQSDGGDDDGMDADDEIEERWDWDQDATGVILRSDQWFPLIRFTDGTEKVLKGTRRTFEFDQGTVEIVCMPLMRGWAATIHRVQGMTLSHVEYHPDETFADGQLYTALTRVRSLQGLRIQGLDTMRKSLREYATAHVAVKNFYEELEAQTRKLDEEEAILYEEAFDPFASEFSDMSELLNETDCVYMFLFACPLAGAFSRPFVRIEYISPRKGPLSSFKDFHTPLKNACGTAMNAPLPFCS